jgi:hypothetical protein
MHGRALIYGLHLTRSTYKNPKIETKLNLLIIKKLSKADSSD